MVCSNGDNVDKTFATYKYSNEIIYDIELFPLSSLRPDEMDDIGTLLNTTKDFARELFRALECEPSDVTQHNNSLVYVRPCSWNELCNLALLQPTRSRDVFEYKPKPQNQGERFRVNQVEHIAPQVLWTNAMAGKSPSFERRRPFDAVMMCDSYGNLAHVNSTENNGHLKLNTSEQDADTYEHKLNMCGSSSFMAIRACRTSIESESFLHLIERREKLLEYFSDQTFKLITGNHQDLNNFDNFMGETPTLYTPEFFQKAEKWREDNDKDWVDKGGLAGFYDMRAHKGRGERACKTGQEVWNKYTHERATVLENHPVHNLTLKYEDGKTDTCVQPFAIIRESPINCVCVECKRRRT